MGQFRNQNTNSNTNNINTNNSNTNNSNTNSNERLRKLVYRDTVFFVVNLTSVIKKAFSIHYITSMKILPYFLR